MTDNLKAKHIISHPALIKAILQEITELGYTYDKNRLLSIGTKTGTVLITFTSDFDNKMHSVRIPKTLEYIRKKDVTIIVSKIILEIEEPANIENIFLISEDIL